jgi:hypothetical protein
MKCAQNGAGGTLARLPTGQPRKGTSTAGRHVCSATDLSSLQSDQPHISRVTEAVSPGGKAAEA